MNALITMRPAQVIKALKDRGYLARQNQQQETLFLNLGGPKSELNEIKCTFQGGILLNPSQNLAYGVSARRMLWFREQVMERRPGKKNQWVRKIGVPGDPEKPNRVSVQFVWSGTGEVNDVRVACPTDTEMGRIWIEGYPAYLRCDIDGYDWDAVERFLNDFWDYCREKEKTI